MNESGSFKILESSLSVASKAEERSGYKAACNGKVKFPFYLKF